jgi:hypothetical protein
MARKKKYLSRKKKKKSSIPKMIPFLIVGFALYAWVSNFISAPSQPNQKPMDLPVAAVNAAPSYALQPALNNWPPAAGQGGTAYADAGKLLTTNYYVMLDASGSMADKKCAENSSKMEVAAQAVGRFARSLPAEANFGLAMFNGAVIKELLPLGTSRDAVGTIAAQITPTASTPLASAIRFSYKKLIAQAQHQLGYGDYYLVLLTDGIADKGQQAGPIVRQILQESPVQIYTIGFCISENHSLNQPGHTVYRSANDPASLEQGLQAVLAESPDFNVSDFTPEK